MLFSRSIVFSQLHIHHNFILFSVAFLIFLIGHLVQFGVVFPQRLRSSQFNIYHNLMLRYPVALTMFSILFCYNKCCSPVAFVVFSIYDPAVANEGTSNHRIDVQSY